MNKRELRARISHRRTFYNTNSICYCAVFLRALRPFTGYSCNFDPVKDEDFVHMFMYHSPKKIVPYRLFAELCVCVTIKGKLKREYFQLKLD